ncbi:MAG TPA: MFS transporter [Candidatus Dormibacteraeota bacterium]|nr:MFS transporter [Candidatus Dormibacteraeota bacterium]
MDSAATRTAGEAAPGVPPLPLGGYRWVILGVGTGAQVAFATINQSLPSISPQLRAHFGLNLETVGVTFSAVLLGQTLTQLAWGFAVDRLGDRLTMAAGLAGSLVTLTAAALAPGFGAFLLLMVATGMFGASINVASARAVSGWFAFHERGFALGVRQSALPLGGALGSVLLPVLAISHGVRPALLAIVGLLAVSLLAVLRWLREPAIDRSVRSGVTLRGLAADPRLLRLTAASSFLVLAQFGFGAFTVLYLHDAKQVSSGVAAGVLVVMQLGGAVARIAAGRWSDRAGQRIGPMRRAALGVALAALLATWLTTLPAPVAGLSLVVAGILAFSWNGLALAAAVELAGTSRSGFAVGYLNTALGLAAAVASPMFAVVVVHSTWQVGFAMLAGCGLLSHLLLRGLRVPTGQAPLDAGGSPNL